MRLLKSIFLGPEDLPEKILWLQRRETWAGDVKGNLIRAVGLGVFGVNEILNYHVFHVVDKRFHLGSLILMALWFMAALFFHGLLKRHALPRTLPYLMPALDIFLLTWLLFLADGPQSPLASIYFLIIALSALRLNPRIVLFTAGAAALGFLSVWDFAKRQTPDLAVPFFKAVIVILALGFMGLILAHGLSRVFFYFDKLTKEEPR